MVLIHPAPPAYSTEGSLAEGKRRDWCEDDRVKARRAPWQEGPHQRSRILTSAARPVLADLKAVSAETEGAVSCHDAAIAAPELVAG